MEKPTQPAFLAHSVSPISLFRVLKIPRRIPPRGLPNRKPIPQVSKPVCRAIFKLPVLEPDVTQHMEPVDTAARVQGRDGPIDSAVFEPAAAGRRPCGPLHECRDVGIVVRCRCLGWRNGADVLRLYLL